MVTEIAPATAEDVVAIYGHPPPYSMQAYVIRQDGRAVGIGGLYYAGQRHVAFCRSVAPISRKVIVRLVRKVAEIIRGRGARVFALRDASIPTSETLLKHMGFQLVAATAEGEVYAWPG